MGDLVKNLVIWTVIAVVIMSLFTGVGGRNTASQEFNYTDFMQQVQTGQVEEVTIAGREISGSFKSGETFRGKVYQQAINLIKNSDIEIQTVEDLKEEDISRDCAVVDHEGLVAPQWRPFGDPPRAAEVL